MGISDLFKVNQFKTEIEQLRADNQRLYNDNYNMHNLLTPEMKDAQALQALLFDLKQKKENLEENISHIEEDIGKRVANINNLDAEIKKRKSQLVSLDDDILVQEFGLYKPQFDFANALDYKEELAKIRAREKAFIKDKIAVLGNINWQVNGSSSQGRKMVSDTQKLLLRAFNTECDELVNKVKYTNFDLSLNRIYKSAEAISKLGSVMNISINPAYLDLKVKELRLAFEYQQKKHEEKEGQKLHELR